VYLARKQIAGKTYYVIRESYRKADAYLSRDLFELGAEPAQFIVYPGGNAFYIDAVVEDGIRSLGSEPAPEDMENLFWPFLNPDIRRKLEPFRRQECQSRSRRRPVAATDSCDAHIFDKRRIHFLKTGQTDPRALGRVPATLLRRFRNKSRDEIEQDFIEMESILRPRDYKTYTYAIFNLQQFFHQRFASRHPEFLDVEEVDGCFIEEVCRLQRDQVFWAGMESGNRLSDYLVRYAVMYFDHDYAARSLAEEYLRDFINRHRHYRPPPSVAVRMEEMAAIFGKSRDALKKMNRRDLWRLYRRRAQELHPDKGGDHERFVKLNEAYQRLVRIKH
jgi:hypothetical protein